MIITCIFLQILEILHKKLKLAQYKKKFLERIMSKYKSKILITICVLLVVSLFSSNPHCLVLAKGELASNSFELELVSTGQVEVLPDQAEVSISIEFVDLNKEQSQKNCVQLGKNVKEHLVSLGMNELDIKNNNSYTYPIDNYGENAFKTYANISFVAHDLESLNDILGTFQSVYIKVTNICYSSTNYDTYYEQAMLLAQKNALERAHRLYPTSNVKLCKIEEIENYYPVTLYREYNPEFLETDNLTPLEISARVNVEFVIG